MIPRFPIQGDIFVANSYLLFLIPFNFDLFHITIPLTFICHDPANLLPDSDVGIKKARKEVV
jgi:hypothetical protein